MKAIEIYLIILTTITTIATVVLSYYILDIDNKLKAHITKTQTSIKSLDSISTYLLKEKSIHNHHQQLKDISIEIEIIKKDINLLYQNTTTQKLEHHNLVNSYKDFKRYFTNETTLK